MTPRPIAGQHGMESARALLGTLPTNWRSMRGSDLPTLIEQCRSSLALWEKGEQPVANLQRAAGYALLALDRAVYGSGSSNPPIEPPPPTPEEAADDKRSATMRRRKRQPNGEGVAA